MSKNHSRTRAFAAPFLLGLIALVATGCPTQPSGPPYYGIIFNAPSVGFVGKTYTPTATATSGLPVSFSLDPTSTGCSLNGGVISYDFEGTCKINADQPGDATHAASAQVQRTIGVWNCPPLYSGTWTATAYLLTGPLYFNATVTAYPLAIPPQFVGTIDLSQLGGSPNAVFQGTVACEVATMNLNGSPVTGWLSYDGKTLSSNYQGVDIVMKAPANAGQ